MVFFCLPLCVCSVYGAPRLWGPLSRQGRVGPPTHHTFRQPATVHLCWDCIGSQAKEGFSPWRVDDDLSYDASSSSSSSSSCTQPKPGRPGGQVPGYGTAYAHLCASPLGAQEHTQRSCRLRHRPPLALRIRCLLVMRRPKGGRCYAFVVLRSSSSPWSTPGGLWPGAC